MENLWALALPLGAALAYVAAALSLKRAADLGVGLWHSTVVCNVLAALVFQSLLLLGGTWAPLPHAWWQPLVIALLFIAGQMATLFALQKGDVSLATPVLGLKILLVALFTTLVVRQGVPGKLWLAAVLSTAGIVVLNRAGGGGARRAADSSPSPVARTVASAGLAAAAYALFDVLVQKWSPAWGMGRLLPLTVALVGVLSCTLIPLFPTPLRSLSPSARRWLVLGGLLMGFQSLLFVSAIAHFGQATVANIVYSSRGLWSVLAVALLGHWFRNAEQAHGGAVLRGRFVGALLMFAAIALLLV